MAKRMPEKDPDATKDYEFDFTDWLGTDTISSFTLTTDTGITVASSSNTTQRVTTWLSGGTAGVDYRHACKIVTAGGRTEVRTMIIPVRDT